MPESPARRGARAAGHPSRRAAMTAGLVTLAGVASPDAARVPAQGSMPQKIAITRRDRKAPHPLLSHAIRSGPLVFLAGIGGWYPEDRPEPGDVKVQIDSALQAMKMILEQAGSSMAHVLKVHMTVADPNRNLAPLNEAYAGHFPDPPPVRSYTGCGADQMGREGVLVQIDCIALVQ